MPAQAEEVIATPQITRLRSILGQVIEEFRADNEEVRNLVEGLGRSYGLPILLDPEINGRVTFALYQSPLNTILDAICAPYGWSWTIEPAGYVIVNRFETKIYRIDYLPVTQTGTSSASVNLTGSSSGGSDSASGGSSSSSNGTSGGNSSGSSSSGGSSLSVAQSTEADFWGRYEKDIAAMLTKDETAIINKFGGVLQVKASRQTHARIESYSHSLMERVRRQVFISVQIVRVDLTNSRQFGVDWNVAAFDLGNDRNSPQIGGNFALPGQQISGRGLAGSTNVTTAGALSLPAPTFAGVIQAGKVSALVRALQQQGNVKIETKPEIATLNNVPAFVQISEDRSFFRRSSETNFNQGTTTNGSPPVTDVTYEERVVSFGNVLEVVPQISDANEVQLALQPAITDLRGVDFSPDGESNAPRQGVSRLRSVVTLRDGETYIMGGFISEQQGNTSRRIPVLGSIPVLGAAFRTDGTISERSEIVVLVSVRVRQPEASAPSLVKPTAPGPAVRAVLPTPTPTPPAVVRAPVARPAPPVSEIPPAPPVSEPPPAVPEPPVAPEVVEEVPVATSSSVPVTGFSP
jgi:type IVB pilus formation R64 PilN family outer membrane protein